MSYITKLFYLQLDPPYAGYCHVSGLLWTKAYKLSSNMHSWLIYKSSDWYNWLNSNLFAKINANSRQCDRQSESAFYCFIFLINHFKKPFWYIYKGYTSIRPIDHNQSGNDPVLREFSHHLLCVGVKVTGKYENFISKKR